MSDQNRGPIPTRRTLLSRLRDWDDQESWRQFFDTYWKLIYGVATQGGLNDAEAQDVVQETLIAVAKRLPDFRYDPALGTFKSWLLLITKRRITDHLRRKGRALPLLRPSSATGSETSPLDRIPDPASLDLDRVWDVEWEKHLMSTALKELKRQIDPKQFQIFDCYVLKEWPVSDVIKTFQVSAAQVYLIKHRVSALLRKMLQKVARPELNP